MKKNIPLIIILINIVLLIIAICVILFIKYRQSTNMVSNVEPYIENNEITEENSITEETENNEENLEDENNAIEETPEENNQNNNNTVSSTNQYYIKVNYQANTVTVYVKDENGNYTVPYKVMVCSTGSDTPTSGVYKISDKYTWRLLFGDVYGQYACRITGHILFHSVPYLQQSPDTLEYWEYDKLGTSASAGCIRLTVKDAKWIYDNCAKGTQVEFYGSSDPGPLGKPSAQKIANEDESVRNWDPTDPNSNNPWKNYDSSKKNNKNSNEVPKNDTTTNNNTNTNTNTNNNNNNNNVSTGNNTTTNNNVDNSIDKNNVVQNNIVENNNHNNTVNQNNIVKDKNVVTNDNTIKSNSNSTIVDNNKINTAI